MKKITMLIGSLLIGSLIYAQQPPQGGAGGGAFWRKGGNTGPFGSPNIFGTATGNNNPIYTYTNGIARMKVNGTFNPTILGVPTNTSGYVGIGNFGGNSPLGNPNIGPMTLLHLEGPNSNINALGGWRSWMQTGMYVKDETDALFVGVKPEGNNRADAIISWSDDPLSPGAGADVLKFIFAAFANNNGNGNGNNPIDGRGLNGYEFMRMSASSYETNSTGFPTGFVGLGPVFTQANLPQSRFHINAEEQLSNWLQFTNATGTNQTASDGLRIGILGQPQANRNGNAFVYQQENRHLLFSTNANTAAGNFNMNNTRERVRITRIGAPTNLPGGGYGQYNPANLANNTTRMSVSHNPANPVTRPLSLLHLGYNTGANALNPNTTDGWRNWMDIGTFTTNGTDNMYVGLKRETGAVPANDRHDAIINWGDNDGTSPLPNGPDNLRFIFTSTTTGTGNPPANSNNGLEVARFDPQLASTLAAPNYGMMGIGDFSPGSPNIVAGQPVDAKLDIDGDLRIRQVTQDNALTQVLVIDPNDQNRVHWKDITPIVGGFGTICGDPNPLMLTNNSEVQLNNFDFHFSGVGGTKFQNNLGVGTNCQINLAGKLHVNRASTDIATTAAYVLNTDASDGTASSSVGLFVKNSAVDVPFTSCRSVAGWFETVTDAAGETGFALYVPDGGGRVSVGFGFPNAQPDNDEPDVCGFVINSGALMEVNGDIYTTGMVTGPSDLNFKTNITPITNALDKVKKLNGVYYDYNNTSYPNHNFSSERQVGLIAQNVDTVLTEVTRYDSTMQAYAMNYDRINALLIEAIKEQDDKVDSLEQLTEIQDSINNDLESRLAVLEQCINEANLCSSTARTTNTTNENAGQSIELSNLNAIILDQNLPNPFAENTTITYSIPDDIMEAQLLFYDMNGRIIKQVDITDRGDSKLTVYGNNLEKGIYTYSLIADGKLIATKKMIKQ